MSQRYIFDNINTPDIERIIAEQERGKKMAESGWSLMLIVSVVSIAALGIFAWLAARDNPSW